MRSRLLPTAVATASLGGLVVAAALAPTATAAPPGAPGKNLSRTVTGERVFDHLEEFQEIADENGGNRAMATPGYEESAQYIERVLRRAGLTTERQYFPVESFEVQDLTVTVPGVELTPIPMTYSPSTADDGVTAGVVRPAIIDGCPEDATTGHADSWEGVDATGRIALVQRGACSFGAKALAAGEAGAAGLIIYNNEDAALNGTLGETNPGYAPTVGVSADEGAAVLAALEADPGLQVTFDLQTAIETTESFNVIAETRGGDDDNVVMLGAHLDGVEEGAGINDNATGSAAILETAVQLNKNKHLNNTVRFAWWGAEEVGLVGSTYYVEDLAANDPGELEDIATYLNFDMVGSPNYTIGVYDADESTYPAPVEVPEGSIASEEVFTDYFDSIDQPWVDSEFSGRSDYDAFISNGVPASGLFTGADAIKTEEEEAIFGGTAGEPLDPNYHSADDDLSNVSMEALDIMSRAIGNAAQELAYSTESINGVEPDRPGRH